MDSTSKHGPGGSSEDAVHIGNVVESATEQPAESAAATSTENDLMAENVATGEHTVQKANSCPLPVLTKEGEVERKSDHDETGDAKTNASDGKTTRSIEGEGCEEEPGDLGEQEEAQEETYEETQLWRDQIEPLPPSSSQSRRSSQATGPGAFAVVNPRPGMESQTRVPVRVHPGENLDPEPLAATLAPTEETTAAVQGLGAAPVTLGSDNDDVEANNTQQHNDIAVAVKIEEEGEGEGQMSWQKMLTITALILILVATAVVLALGLAGMFNTDDNLDTGMKSEQSVAPRLEEIRERGYVTCHYRYIAGFLYKDETTGEVTGFNSIWCKAIAAAIFGPEDINSKIQYIDWSPYTNSEEADITPVGITPTMSRKAYFEFYRAGLKFSMPFSFDGLRAVGDPFYIACAQDNWKHIDECEDLRVCVFQGTTFYTFIRSVLPARRIVSVDQNTENMADKMSNGDCNVLLVKDNNMPEEGYGGNYTVGDKLLTTEPWAIVLSTKSDPQWNDFVNAVVHSLLVAEQHNITKATAYLFPPTNVFGEAYTYMFQNANRAVGNLAEVYQVHRLPFQEREPMNTINDGTTGLMYSYPFGDLKVLEEDRGVLGPNLERVLSRERLLCGVRYDRPGFATKLEDGGSSGIDIDFCGAVASSLFGSVDAVEVVELDSPEDGFQKLASHAVDIFAGAFWNLENDVREPATGLGFAFSQPYYYDSEDRSNACLATLQDDSDWATYVFWLVTATIYAEEQRIDQKSGNEMPLVNSYGSGHQRMLRDAILNIGNYGEIYKRNLEATRTRSGRNLLNSSPYGPQHYPMPGLV